MSGVNPSVDPSVDPRADPEADPWARWDLTRVINAAGTMTAIGASRVGDEVRAHVDAIMQGFVHIHEAQARAFALIAEVTGAEGGCVVGCSAAGVTLSVAAAITGDDLAMIEALPEAANGRTVVMQAGHCINYGAPVDQAVRLAGAKVAAIGTAALCETYHLEAALDAAPAAAVFVLSHHTVREGELPLPLFVSLCHARGVPVIVDAAAEYHFRDALTAGADLVVVSGHKFFGGVTAGIVAGRRDLIRATYLQHRGIGRKMKASKEAIIGAMTALEAWKTRDHTAERGTETARVARWLERLGTLPGVSASIHEDWTGNPVQRARLVIDPSASGCPAHILSARLAARSPSIVVRDDHAERGEIYLDPCNLTDDEAERVADAFAEELHRAAEIGSHKSWADAKRESSAAILRWPDP